MKTVVEKLLVTLGFWAALLPSHALAAGTWTPLAHTTPGGYYIGLMLLLSDGTVMAHNDSSQHWLRLTPDIHGSYANGTWTNLADMHYERVYFASDVLRDGRVFVAGGEDSAGTTNAEVYNPLTDTWTPAPVPATLLNPTQPPPYGCSSAGQAFEDPMSMILPNGTVLIAPACSKILNGTLIYDPASNTWSTGPVCVHSGSQGSAQWEASWVKLPDDSILTIDEGTIHSERYIPASNTWVSDRDVPVALYNAPPGEIKEIGAAFLLPNGNALFLGSTGHTALYTPSGNTSMGTWTIGPDIDIPNGFVADDGPAAMMVNGKILCLVGTLAHGGTGPPNYFYEYDYADGPVGSFAAVSCPTNSALGSSYDAFSNTFYLLDLPDGTVLASVFNSSQLYVYQPDCCPVSSGKPGISSISANGDGSYHLTGTGLNGISQGAVFGDDAQMDSNYPLVRLSDGNGNVYYARTFNWSSTGVMTGCRVVSTEFRLPPNLPAGSYSLVVVANGISSDPVPFPGTSSVIWVAFGGFPGTGVYPCPYNALGLGVAAVPSGGTIIIKGPGTSSETMTISKPMTIRSVDGAATIGH